MKTEVMTYNTDTIEAIKKLGIVCDEMDIAENAKAINKEEYEQAQKEGRITKY